MRLINLADGLTPFSACLDEHMALMGACLADLGVTKPVTIAYGANVGAHLLAGMDPDTTVVFQSENMRAETVWNNVKYREALKRFRCIDYARENEGAYECAAWAHLPTLHHPVAERFTVADDTDRDVLFCGSVSARRRKAFDAISKAGHALEVGFGLFGAERDAAAARSAMVLNLHCYQPPVFEALRVADALSNGCAVVSEPGENALTQAEYADFAILASIEEMPDAIGRVKGDLAAHRERAARFRKTDMRPEVARVLKELDI